MENPAKYRWINGEFIEWNDAKIHVMTHSLHYSGAVFEGIKAYNGKVFLAEEHAKRLIYSANSMGLDLEYSVAEIMQYTEELLEKNAIKDAYIRPLVWRGSEAMKMYHEDLSTNFMILALPSNKPVLSKGLKVNVSKWRKAHPLSMDPQAKSSAHYAVSINVQKEAKKAGFDDSIQLDHDGNIAECTVSNIFFCKANEIYTPIAENYLNGLTRKFVIKMAKEMDLYVEERAIKPEEMAQFDSCFMTGTSVEITPIDEIEYNGMNINYDNKIVAKLQDEFIKRTGKRV